MYLPTSKRYILLLELVLGISLLAILASPLMLPEGSVPELDGNVGRVDNWDELEALPWPQRAVYIIGDVYCHQQADRSFTLNGNQLPVCSRDLGILCGSIAGLAAFAVRGGRARWPLLALLLLPMAVDGGLQALTSYESNNLLRTLTGSLAGLAVGWGAGSLMVAYFRPGDDARDTLQHDDSER